MGFFSNPLKLHKKIAKGALNDPGKKLVSKAVNKDPVLRRGLAKDVIGKAVLGNGKRRSGGNGAGTAPNGNTGIVPPAMRTGGPGQRQRTPGMNTGGPSQPSTTPGMGTGGNDPATQVRPRVRMGASGAELRASINRSKMARPGRIN